MRLRLVAFACIFFLVNLPMKLNAQVHHIREVEFKGLRFSDPEWLKSYLPLHCPCEFDDQKILSLQSKLLTTQVFQTVDFALQTITGEQKKLIIDVQEKWTVIPVLRAAYGGGTPLVVAGIYDSHFLGRLYTFGVESRTYGSAPPGGVAWFRAPRWKQGSHYFNVEIWRDNRVRALWNNEDEEIGRIYGSALAINSDFLMPINGQTPAIQLGLRYQYRDQDLLNWDSEPVITDAFSSDLRTETTHSTLLRGIYDDVSVSGVNLAGLRVLLSGGPVFSEHEKTRMVWEEELFYYKLWKNDWNLALHQWLGYTTSKSYQSLTFLGGFDSIRGIPDGALVGNKAVYANAELRKLLVKTQYAWLQAATYLDYGSAVLGRDEWGDEGRSSFGMGMRLAIPQVHRLMFRVDYAWSLDRAGTSSVSAGLNQFIDPYRPL